MLAVALALAASGCSRFSKTEGSPLRPAAKVDGTVVSQQAVALAVPDKDERRRQAGLDAFVSEQVLANAALRSKLDNEADVAAALESARRQILARAYVAKVGSGMPRTASADIRQYYEQHPDLFARRRIYRMQEITIPGPTDRVDEIVARFAKLNTFNDRAAWLKQNNIPFTIGLTVKAAEDIPADLLANLAQMKDGTAFNMPGDKRLTTVQITGIEDKPLSLAEAQDTIDRYLSNQRLGATITREADRLRGAAKVEYFAPYGAKAL
jgi:EpsD family peptidyl-prolyl cis-trans isomerase